MLKLWGRKTSSNVQKILWALEELGQPYEHEIVGGIYGGKDKNEKISISKKILKSKIYSLNQAPLGRTATMNHSMESSETNDLMVKFLTT